MEFHNLSLSLPVSLSLSSSPFLLPSAGLDFQLAARHKNLTICIHLQQSKSLVIILRPLTAPRPPFMLINYAAGHCSLTQLQWRGGWGGEGRFRKSMSSFPFRLELEYAKRLIPSGLARSEANKIRCTGAHRQTDRQLNRQTDTQTDGQTDMQSS